MKNHQLIQLIIIQFKEFYREPGALFWSFIFPILMAWGLGISFTSKPVSYRNIAVINAETDSTFENFINKNNFMKQKSVHESVVYQKETEHAELGKTIFKLFETNEINAVVLLKRGIISMIMTEKNENFEYNFDVHNSDAQLCYIQMSELCENNNLYPAKDVIKPMEIIGTRYIDFLIPGLITMGLMNSCLWGISYSMIENRKKKLLRRMVAAPMKKSYYLLSKLIARLVITFIEAAAIIIFANIVFQTRIEGSLAALIAILVAGNITFIGISILIASRTSSIQMGNGLMNLVTLPMMVLSGIFFSYQNLPDWAIGFIKYLPLTIFTDAVRSIFIEGAGIIETFVPFCVLVIIGSITFITGLKIFKWY